MAHQYMPKIFHDPINPPPPPPTYLMYGPFEAYFVERLLVIKYLPKGSIIDV